MVVSYILTNILEQNNLLHLVGLFIMTTDIMF